MDAFDADVLIYTASPGHPLGTRVRELISAATGHSCVGSTLLVPELLIKPQRVANDREGEELERVLAKLHLLDVDRRIAEFAVDIGARRGLKTVDAVHLATAVLAGAERFITNNRRDFGRDIDEIDIVYPDEL